VIWRDRRTGRAASPETPRADSTEASLSPVSCIYAHRQRAPVSLSRADGELLWESEGGLALPLITGHPQSLTVGNLVIERRVETKAFADLRRGPGYRQGSLAILTVPCPANQFETWKAKISSIPPVPPG
jgi:hypothetical protein